MSYPQVQYTAMLMIVFTVIVGASALLLAGIQLEVMSIQRDIMDGQTVLMRQQLDLMSRQDQIVEAQLRRITLEVMFNIQSYDQTSTRLVMIVSAHNIGQKTVRDFYWQLGIPQELFFGSSFMMNGTTMGTELLNYATGQYQVTKGFCDKPLYPTRHLILCVLTLTNVTPTMLTTLVSKFVHEDGTDPPGEAYAEEAIDVSTILPGTTPPVI